MVEKTKKPTKRKIPQFLRKDWHKKIKLGSTVKKNRKWRGAKGRQNKIRLGIRAQGARPKIGYSQPSELRGKIDGNEFTLVENMKQLVTLKKGDSIIIASIGAKKRALIVEESKKIGLVVLNERKDKK
ncbi:hypothetical protein HN747_04145 [archaeon]|jgi:ribosomal protein L32E|nr:hypothetical protein [archaeon]